MAKYKIYAGLGGSFGGATFRGLFTFDNASDAEELAISLAKEEYESYSGMYGFLDYDSAYQELVDEGIDEDDIDEALIEVIIEEDMEMWIDYNFVQVPDGYELTEDEKEEME